MDGKTLIRSIKLTNLLSFGPKGEQIELEPLNVLIGPNASGKSNFVEAIALPGDLARGVEPGVHGEGTGRDWLWKGRSAADSASIDLVVSWEKTGCLDYHLAFRPRDERLAVEEERLDTTFPDDAERQLTLYDSHPDTAQVMVRPRQGSSRSADEQEEELRPKSAMSKFASSMLSQLRDPTRYPEITYLAWALAQARFYRDWTLGPRASPRQSQPAHGADVLLAEDASNLWMVLRAIHGRASLWPRILSYVGRFYERADKVSLPAGGDRGYISMVEKGLNGPIPATRLSDGTLRFLCLLAILCHPEPPPLVVIEEPELGLHPDALALVAELLMEASQRMQLIVTTHSDALVSELSDVPESVLVCERDDEGSHLRRLEKDRLKEWLEDYMLGDLWRMGKIGGNP